VNLLDVIIIVMLVLAGLNGYRRGAALQLTTYAGLILGLFVGAVVAPRFAGLARSPIGSATIALIVLLSFGVIGDAAGWLIGLRIWAIARRSALGAVDSVAGSVLGVGAVLVAVWFLGYNLANGPSQAIAGEIRGSAIVRGLDRSLPRPPAFLAEVRQFLNRFGFPEVFIGVPPAPAGPVKGPTQGQTAAVARRVEDSTVRIVGRACNAIQEGSGFVAAPNYVVTNAHVVAGVSSPQVQQQNGGSQSATTVLFDPRVDIAVLRVSTTPGSPLPIDQSEEGRGTQGAVLGFPGGGSLEFGPAAIRQELDAQGRDIYGKSVITREVYELQAIVRPGNSGGPFVLLNGRVGGVVFAASTTDQRVGYALTSRQIAPLVRSAVGRTQQVSTDGCTR
jgi:S1-C subfamily serine protease